MNKEVEKEITEGIREKIGATYMCPICKKKEFTILPGFFLNVLHANEAKLQEVGPGVMPLVPVMCEHCGYVSQHSLHCLVNDWGRVCKLLNVEDYKHE